jgi:hypothetical protein
MMNWRLIRRGVPISLACAGLLCGCYYDPYTGYTSPYPPPAYGPPPPGAYGPGGPGPQAEGGPPPGAMPGADAPGAYAPGGPAAASGGPPPGAYAPGEQAAPGALVTRQEFIARAVRWATRMNRDPQRAAQRAGRVFDRIDVSHSGAVTQEQINEWRAAHRRPPNPAPPAQPS